ncbi:MAG: hypothetical protein ACI9XB_004610, partial [Gammaproteobacteria bacterium]
FFRGVPIAINNHAKSAGPTIPNSNFTLSYISFRKT